MGTANGLIAGMRKLAADPRCNREYGKNHNGVTEWYNLHVDHVGDGPWCDMTVTMAAYLSDNQAAVVGGKNGTKSGKGFAYCPAHANWFRARGRWIPHTRDARPGDIVFFNWSGRVGPDAAEHVGVVVENLGNGYIKTIEGNAGDVLAPHTRHESVVAGLGRPAFDATPSPSGDDGMKILTDLGLAAPVALAAGRDSIAWTKEYADVGAHTDPKDGKGYPSIFPTGATRIYAVSFGVHLSAEPKAGVRLAVASYKRDTNDFEYDIRTVTLDSADYGTTLLVAMSEDHKYRLDLINDSGEPVTVERAYLTIAS